MKPRDQHIFDKPENVRRLLWALYFACAALFVGDFVYHRHVMRDWEATAGFYAIFGFVACVSLVLIAKQLRKLLMRSEKYYDE